MEHPTKPKGRSRPAKILATALAAVAVSAGGALGLATQEADAAQAVPDWVLDFSGAGDAFEGGGGGGGGGSLPSLGSGSYDDHAAGRSIRVLWQDFRRPDGEVLRKCGIHDDSASVSRPIPCP